MPLNPENFVLEDYEFRYTPLKLQSARKLYLELVNYFGGSVGSLVETFRIDEKLLDTDVATALKPMVEGLSSAIKDISLSINFDWYNKTMTEVLLPQLEVTRISDGHKIPKEDLKGWYETEFATKCFLDLKVFLKCLKIQYSDFLALKGSLLNLIKRVPLSTKL